MSNLKLFLHSSLYENWVYLKYVVRHKKYVFQVGRLLGVNGWQLLIHDWHKFLPSEWCPYVAHFYGINKDLKPTDPDYDRAWLHHCHRAPHHWQHWVINDHDGVRAIEMPEKYALEMVADWVAAGWAINNKKDGTGEWYTAHKETIVLALDTKNLIEEKLKFLQGYGFM